MGKKSLIGSKKFRIGSLTPFLPPLSSAHPQAGHIITKTIREPLSLLHASKSLRWLQAKGGVGALFYFPGIFFANVFSESRIGEAPIHPSGPKWGGKNELFLSGGWDGQLLGGTCRGGIDIKKLWFLPLIHICRAGDLWAVLGQTNRPLRISFWRLIVLEAVNFPPKHNPFRLYKTFQVVPSIYFQQNAKKWTFYSFIVIWLKERKSKNPTVLGTTLCSRGNRVWVFSLKLFSLF